MTDLERIPPKRVLWLLGHDEIPGRLNDEEWIQLVCLSLFGADPDDCTIVEEPDASVLRGHE